MELDQLALLESKDGLTKVDIFSWSGKFLISGSLRLDLPNIDPYSQPKANNTVFRKKISHRGFLFNLEAFSHCIHFTLLNKKDRKSDTKYKKYTSVETKTNP